MGEEKKGKVIVEGVLYEFSNDTIHTVTEGFVFEEKGWFSKKLSEHLHNREYYDYEQYANELMVKYYDYYQQIKEIDYEYVLRGAVLTCTHGNKETRLDALKDHGVYFRNQPVMTCKDCELEKNIFSFGACGNEKFEPLYSEEAPHPAQTAIDRNGQERYVCLPVLLGEWGYGDIDSRSLLIGEVLIDKMYKVYKKESFDSKELSKDTIEQIAKDQIQNAAEDAEYSQALMKCYNLLCLYGGVITIEENPETEEETIVEETPELEEELETGENGSRLGMMVFIGKDYIIAAENKIPYIYSTKQYKPRAEIKYPEWKGKFDNSMDLTFGIGHSIQTEEEFERISKIVQTYSESDLDKFINDLLDEDMSRFVNKVNKFCEDHEVYLTQNQFDAITILQYNCDFNMESSELGEELMAHSGEREPQFVKENIVEGFTYTKQDGVRIDGLVTRRNNEINLFLEADYTYFDSKEKVISQGIDEIKYP